MIWYIESVISWFIISSIMILISMKFRSDRIEKIVEMKINIKFALIMAIIASLIPVIRLFFVAELVEILVLSDKDFKETINKEKK